jgi:hypothetical protein
MTTTVAAAEVRERARQAYRVSVAAGAGLSGKPLGEQFGRSERWGRARIAEVRSALPERRAAGDPSRDNCELGAGAAAAGEFARLSRRTDEAIDMTQAEDGAAPVPRGARFVAWLGFVFGSVMSVVANVLHAWLPADERPAGWSPGIAQKVGSAVWPVGLLLSVVVLSRVRWAPGVWWALARYGGAGTVAVGSAVRRTTAAGHVVRLLAQVDRPGVAGESS